MSKCKRCHREIRNSKSVNNGYGPTCLKKIQVATRLDIGKTGGTEKSFVPIFDKLRTGQAEKEPDKWLDDNGDENKSTTWTDMYGIIHILESGD